MVFNLKRKKEKPNYNRLYEETRQRQFKGKVPKSELFKEGLAESHKIPKRIHESGRIIKYKGEDYVIVSSSNKGIVADKIRYAEITKKGEDRVFIPESEVDTHVKPHAIYTLS